MLVSSNDVAKRLKITNRAVQNKCKQYGLKKISNQYQITTDIAEQWYKEVETKTETKQNRSKENNKTSHRSDKNSSFLMWFTAAVTIIVLTMFYLNLNSQITETKKEQQQEQTEHKKEVKQLQKKVDSSFNVIGKKELEIQRLKLKDSLRLFKHP
jgi:ATP-dependent Zn protease